MNMMSMHLGFSFFIILSVLLAKEAGAHDEFPSISPKSVSVVGYSKEDLLSQDTIAELFKRWCESNNVSYPTQEETLERLQIFTDNLLYIDSFNARNTSTYSLGLNTFADLTDDEFERIYTLNFTRIPRQEEEVRASHSSTQCRSPPASIDWREKGAVTPVKNQLQCGSCWAFSAVAAIESKHFLTTGQLISLSEQELISCDKRDKGCKGGFRNNAFSWVIRNGGINSESNYPYTGKDGACNIPKKKEKVAKINGFAKVAISDAALMCAVALRPVSACLNVSPAFKLYKTGVFDGPCSSSPSKLNHCVLIVGYGTTTDGEKYWIVKNSWGDKWGNNGYIHIKRAKGNGVCGINTSAAYPTKYIVTQDGPEMEGLKTSIM